MGRSRSWKQRVARAGSLIVISLIVGGGAAASHAAAGAAAGLERASWLLERDRLATTMIAGERLEQTEIGDTKTYAAERRDGGVKALPLLMSAVLPGSGEVALGYRRGWFMMAADIAGWIGVAHYANKGEEKEREFMAFAEEHWDEDQFFDAYSGSPNDEYLLYDGRGIGLTYFPDVEAGTPPPLYVSRAEDEREWFENLGKWEAFVFGWDDFVRADDHYGDLDYPLGNLDDLNAPWASANRETYRRLRRESNDAFDTRDTLLYVNIGLRVFSVLQVAYLQGLFSGGDRSELRVAGHEVNIIAEPRGFTASRIGAAVSF